MNVPSVFNKKLEGMCNKYYDYMNFPFTNAVKQTKQVVNADVVMIDTVCQLQLLKLISFIVDLST